MNCILILVACLVGFIGDLLLQIGSKVLKMGGAGGWGLTGYFKLHGAAESTFIAGGMMSLFYSVYLLLGIPVNYAYLALFGIAVDLLFRQTMLFGSLKGYYQYFNYFWSGFWMAVPMMLPFFVYNVYLQLV